MEGYASLEWSACAILFLPIFFLFCFCVWFLVECNTAVAKHGIPGNKLISVFFNQCLRAMLGSVVFFCLCIRNLILRGTKE